MYRLPDRRVSAYDDDWEDTPAQSLAHQWLLGGFAAAAFLAYGLFCVFTRTGSLPGRGGATLLQGSDATALGFASAGAALVLHCHYFWGNLYHLSVIAAVGKIAGLITFIGSLGYLMVHLGVYGR